MVQWTMKLSFSGTEQTKRDMCAVHNYVLILSTFARKCIQMPAGCAEPACTRAQNEAECTRKKPANGLLISQMCMATRQWCMAGLKDGRRSVDAPSKNHFEMFSTAKYIVFMYCMSARKPTKTMKCSEHGGTAERGGRGCSKRTEQLQTVK